MAKRRKRHLSLRTNNTGKKPKGEKPKKEHEPALFNERLSDFAHLVPLFGHTTGLMGTMEIKGRSDHCVPPFAHLASQIGKRQRPTYLRSFCAKTMNFQWAQWHDRPIIKSAWHHGRPAAKHRQFYDRSVPDSPSRCDHLATSIIRKRMYASEHSILAFSERYT